MLKKRIFKIILAIVLISGIIGTLVFVRNFNKKSSISNNDGYITVIVNNINNEKVSEKRLAFNEGDTLFDIINNNYDLKYDNTAYGHYILGISDKTFNISTNGQSTFIWLEIAYLKENASYSSDIDFNDYEKIEVNMGIDNLTVVNNMILGINERDDSHITSMFNNNTIKKDNSNKTFKIILYIILGSVLLFVLGLYIYKFKTSDKKMTIRELSLLSIMTVLLFVQEELLSFLPNIQLTFLLLALYVSVFGLKNTTLIVIVHVILDNMIMGSMTPITIIPMLLGYLVYILLIYLVRNKNLGIIVLLASIGSLIYCYLFMITNALFLDINVFHYFIADIPFEILLVLSTILTITYLYRPLERYLKQAYNNDYEKENV